MSICSRIFSLQGLIFILTLIIAYRYEDILTHVVSKYHKCEAPEVEVKNDTSVEEKIPEKPTFWLLGDDVDEQFYTVDAVLKRLGFDRATKDISDSENHQKGWNLLWTNNVTIETKKVEFHQKINHIPGSHFWTSKDHLKNFDFVLDIFTDSEELKKYSDNHPDDKFLLISKAKGTTVLASPSKATFTPEDDLYAQKILDNPLLYKGHKFMFSIFVLVTSVDPLRLYYFPKNFEMKFCSKPSVNKDFSDPETFMFTKSSKSGIDFQPTQDYFFNAYTFREALDEYLRQNKADVDEVWRKVENSIRSVVVSKEKDIVEYLEKIDELKYPYFELFTFDFTIDKEFNPYLITINTNPDISGLSNHKTNQPYFENLLYNLFNLIGAGTTFQKKFIGIEEVEVEMMVAYSNSRTVTPEYCIYECDHYCHGRCYLCTRCMDQAMHYETIVSYLEQMNSGDFERIFPPNKRFMEEIDEDFLKNLHGKSKIETEWYIEMCKKNKRFC